MKFKGLIIALIIVVGFVVYHTAYIVDETEQVVVTSSAGSSVSRSRPPV